MRIYYLYPYISYLSYSVSSGFHYVKFTESFSIIKLNKPSETNHSNICSF